MSNHTDDARVDLAREIHREARRLHTAGCTRYDLLYFLNRTTDGLRLLLEVLDESSSGDSVTTPREPAIPDTAHTFTSSDGATYTCTRCGRVADHESVWRLSIFEECEGEQARE